MYFSIFTKAFSSLFLIFSNFPFTSSLPDIYCPHFDSAASISVQFSSVTQSCTTLCDPMNCSTPGLSVHHQLPEITQTHVHRPSCNTYHLAWVSLTLDVVYLFTAAPAKRSRCSLLWMRGISSMPPFLTFNVG